ncbi:MAG: hypothetical protein JXA25_00500 [Anaerolineales bacterium]|nr:hypothetical protein [Anaerolineales bacterium]
MKNKVLRTVLCTWLFLALFCVDSSTHSVYALPLSEPSVSISPSSGPPGTHVLVTGAGFFPDSGHPPHEIHWRKQTGRLLGSFETDSSGVFTAPITVPADISEYGDYHIWVCEGCGNTNIEKWVSATFTVLPPVPTIAPVPPTPAPPPTVCDVQGGPGEVLLDFEDLPTEENLRSTTHLGVLFSGDANVYTIAPTVITHSASHALTIAPAMEFGSYGTPIRFTFENLQDFVGLYVGLNNPIWAETPITAVLTAFALDEEGRRITAGTDSVSVGPEAADILECLSVEGSCIFEATLDFGTAADLEILDDLVLRGPAEPVPVPEDENPPQVTISLPEAGAVLYTGGVLLDGEITEDRMLNRAEVLVNGTLYDALGFSPAGYTASGERRYLFRVDSLLADAFECGENRIEVAAYDEAGLRGADDVSFLYYGDGDLELTRIEPVQVVYDAPALVKNKATAFRAVLDSSFSCPVEINFQLQLPEEKWSLGPPRTGGLATTLPPSWAYPETWGPVEIPADTEDFEVMLPYIEPGEEGEAFGSSAHPAGLIFGREAGGVYGPDVRVAPRPITDPVTFQVVIDPNNLLPELNESNNMLPSGSYKVISTRSWSFLFVPYRTSSGAPEAGHFDLTAPIDYLLGVFPLSDSKIRYAITGTDSYECPDDSGDTCVYTTDWADGVGRDVFLADIARMAAASGYDMAVGVGSGGGGGAIKGYTGGVFIGQTAGIAALAHEFNHGVTAMGDIYSLDCLVMWDEAYCEHADGSREYCCHIDGYEIPDGAERTNCYYNDAGEMVCEEQTKLCAESCNCSIYRRSAPAGVESLCQETEADGSYTLPDCGAGCCWRVCEAICADGTVYNGPDGRSTSHPASEGFWVNRWMPVEDSCNYFMDISSGPDAPGFWMRLDNTVQHCKNEIFSDGYINLLSNANFLTDIDPKAMLVSGWVERTGTASFDPVFYLPEASLDLLPGQTGAFTIIIMGTGGAELFRSGFDIFFEQTDPDAGELHRVPFLFRLPWFTDLEQISLLDPDGKEIASRTISAHAPELTITKPAEGDTWWIDRDITIRWNAGDPDGDVLVYAVDISPDNGETWLPLVMDYIGTRLELSPSRLETDVPYLLRVRASDGLLTATATTAASLSSTAGPPPFSTLLIAVGLGVLLVLGGWLFYRAYRGFRR